MSLDELIDRTTARRKRDAERAKAQDPDECQLCLAQGPDMRSLFLRCMYAVHEVVPEAIDLWDVRAMEGYREFYTLRFCKTCRSRLLHHLSLWRAECVAQREVDKDSDGCPVEADPERNIPLRERGAVRMLTDAEWLKWKDVHGDTA